MNALNHYKSWFWIIAGVFLISTTACTKGDVSDPFINLGKVSYPAKADSLIARGGRNRIELSWLLVADPKVKSYKVYWNNRKDSVSGEVQKTANVDVIKLMLNNMAEGTYTFEVFTFDKDKNASVIASVLGKVYGDNYEGSLLPRAYKSVTRVNDDFQVNWMEAELDNVVTDIEYKNTQGANRTVKANNKDLTSLIQGLKFWGGEISYTSKFLPEPLALDTFYARKVTYQLPGFSWNNYNLIFSHYGNLIVTDKNGHMYRMNKKVDGTYGEDMMIYKGLNAILAFSHKDNIISMINTGTASGIIQRIAAPISGSIGPTVQITTGWNVYDRVIGVQNGFIVRYSSTGTAANVGKINYAAFNPTTDALTVTTGIATGYQQYDFIVYVSSGALIARKPTGELYRITVNASTGALTGTTLIATGWNQFDLIGSNDNAILARKPNGELWNYPMSGAVLGTGVKVINEVK